MHVSDAYARSVIRECWRDSGPITSFAVVRHPVDVRASAWKWLTAYGGYNGTFDEYVRRGDFHAGVPSDRHYTERLPLCGTAARVRVAPHPAVCVRQRAGS
jgi:hypothetical protein